VAGTPDHLIVDLRNISAADMAPLLDEETVAWRAALDWDFEPSAELVRRFVGMQALNGFALLEGGRTIGYAYYIREEKKGLIGDLYVCERDRTPERENGLIEAMLEALWRSPGVRRVEGQLLLLDSPLKRKVPFASRFKPYPRASWKCPRGRLWRSQRTSPQASRSRPGRKRCRMIRRGWWRRPIAAHRQRDQ